MQIIIVSINGPIIATIPSRTGSSVFAAAWAIAALPNPASFENAARVTPITATPIKPPNAAFLKMPNSILKRKPLVYVYSLQE